MQISKFFIAASLLSVAAAQDDGSSTITEDPSTSSSTTEFTGPTITLPPQSCAAAGFDNCYQIIEIITPTVYVILTVDDAASAGDSETIRSGDPILTQTENIATATDDKVEPPITAILAISYSESMGTTCDADTVTSTYTILTGDECALTSVAAVQPPAETTKTLVYIKAREDDSINKGTETNGNGGVTSPTPDPAGNTDGVPVAVTSTNAEPAPTDGGDTPTEGGNDTPTEVAPTDGGESPSKTEDGASQPTENNTGTSPTSAEDTPQQTEGQPQSETQTQTESPNGTPPPNTIAQDASTTSSGSTSASEESIPSSDSTVPPTDSSTPPSPDTTSSIPTDNTSTPTENTSTPTDDSNSTSTDGLTTRTGGQGSSTGAPAGFDETGKPEVTTAFTTIAEVSNGSTKFVTSAVSTQTRSAIGPSTSDGGSGAGSNFLVQAQLLLGAAGLAAIVGL